MSLSIETGPKLPPAYNGTPEVIKGTFFAIGEAQSTKYIPGHTGAPIPGVWDDGNPKMQIVGYLVGQSGKAMRVFFGKSTKAGSAWLAWVEAVKALGAKDFDVLIGHTFQINCKTTYKPDGDVAFREWAATEVPGEDYRPALLKEWQALPKGVLPTFYYPGHSPEDRANATPVAAPPAVTAPPAVQTGGVVATVVEDTPPTSVYDEDIPF